MAEYANQWVLPNITDEELLRDFIIVLEQRRHSWMPSCEDTVQPPGEDGDTK